MGDALDLVLEVLLNGLALLFVATGMLTQIGFLVTYLVLAVAAVLWLGKALVRLVKQLDT